MIKHFLIILRYNILVLLGLLGFIFFIFFLLNIFFSGQPRYWEIVHNKNYINSKTEKEKIIQIKKNILQKTSYLSIFDDGYSKLNYSGFFEMIECGSIEGGEHNLIYQNDRYNFRENRDSRYISSDYVLIGDSFVHSICENKPNDLKTKLLNKSNFSYLNLGRQGTDYPIQFLILDHYTKKTSFKGVVWFFYEGNDYETISDDIGKKKLFPKYKNKVIGPTLPQILPVNEYLKLQLNKYNKLNYELNTNHNISTMFRFKVWLAEYIRGFSVLLKFFKNYADLLNVEDYNKVLNDAKNYLNQKNVENRYIVYIPSWQKLSLYKLKKLNLYEKHPQIQQLDRMKINVKETAEKNGFIFIDTERSFFELENPLTVFHYELNTHFNELGNEILSDAVTQKIN